MANLAGVVQQLRKERDHAARTVEQLDAALAALDGGKTLVVKNMRELNFIDLAGGRIKETLPTPGRGRDRPGFSVVGLAVHDGKVYATGADRNVSKEGFSTDSAAGLL